MVIASTSLHLAAMVTAFLMLDAQGRLPFSRMALRKARPYVVG